MLLDWDFSHNMSPKLISDDILTNFPSSFSIQHQIHNSEPKLVVSISIRRCDRASRKLYMLKCNCFNGINVYLKKETECFILQIKTTTENIIKVVAMLDVKLYEKLLLLH